MGVVHLAHDEEIDRQVVIKTIKSGAKQFVNRLRREAKALGALDHEHITTIYDIGFDEEGLPYLVMELAEGETIETMLMERGKLDLEDGIRLAVMIARALHYAHGVGVLHCDITPGNVMVTSGVIPKIMDFGIARWQQEEQNRPEPKSVYGTPAYMSPEQIKGKPLDCTTDIYSLGVLTFEMLSGLRPFGRTGSSCRDLETARSVITDSLPSLSEIEDRVDAELEDIINRALVRDRARRYRTAAKLADALERYLSAPRALGSATDTSRLRAFRNLRKLFASLFDDFTDGELQKLISISSDRRFSASEVIIEEGASDATLFLVCQGEVSVLQRWDEGDRELKTLHAGECFGEMTFVSKRPRSASVVAKTNTRVIAVNEASMVDLPASVRAKLSLALAAIISEKLRLADKEIKRLTGLNEEDPID
jgi:serine/threonine protein kinase